MWQGMSETGEAQRCYIRFMLRPSRLWLIPPVAIGMFLAAALAGGCAGGGRGSAMSDSSYIELMTELIALKNTMGTGTLDLPKERLDAMARHGVTLEDLEKKAVLLADDPSRALAVWSKIREKIQEGG
jgi:hypothetical protein